jgi:hypothetical protein
MATVTVAAVQAAYILMDQRACMDKAVTLLGQAADAGARIVVFPEVYIPGTPIWIDFRPIWDGDEDWYAMLVDQAVVVPGMRHIAQEGRCYVMRGRPGRGARRPAALRRGGPTTAQTSSNSGWIPAPGLRSSWSTHRTTRRPTRRLRSARLCRLSRRLDDRR